MNANARATYTVTIAGHTAGRRGLSPLQVAGHACVGCERPGADELIPVGVIMPPSYGTGLAMACQSCAPAILTP